jgi:hypothetical protein
VIGGIIGSGKSTLAAALGRELAAPVVSSDRTRKASAGIAPTARSAPSLYDKEHTERNCAEVVFDPGPRFSVDTCGSVPASVQASLHQLATAGIVPVVDERRSQ